MKDKKINPRSIFTSIAGLLVASAGITSLFVREPIENKILLGMLVSIIVLGVVLAVSGIFSAIKSEKSKMLIEPEVDYTSHPSAPPPAYANHC